MGGTVTVVIRESDGTEHRMQRWTNSTPWGICNAKMIAEDRAHIDEYLSQWRSMRDDFEENGEHGKFPMTAAYFPCQGFAPVSYGFILLDFKTKHLLSHQGYTDLESVHGSAIRLETLTGDNVCNDTDTQRLLELLRAGRVNSFNARYNQRQPLSQAEIAALNDARSISQFCENKDLWNFPVDWSPFTVIDYEHEDSGMQKAFEKVKELGFTFSEAEENLWQEWIAGDEQEEEEA